MTSAIVNTGDLVLKRGNCAVMCINAKVLLAKHVYMLWQACYLVELIFSPQLSTMVCCARLISGSVLAGKAMFISSATAAVGCISRLTDNAQETAFCSQLC